MDEASHGIAVDHDGVIMRVTLDAPEHLNAQTPSTWRRLAAIGRDVPAHTRVIVLTSSGRSFCAGLDRRMFAEGIPGEPSLPWLAQQSDGDIDEFIQQAQSAFTWWRQVNAITIAMVHGHAIGAGFQLALACDLMVVADDAQLAMRETSLGLVPDLAGTGPLVSAVGYSRALEICATGRFVGAAEAVSIGLAIAQVPQSQWDTYLAEFLQPIIAADADAVGELKALLGAVGTPGDQCERERQAQLRRLRQLPQREGR